MKKSTLYNLSHLSGAGSILYPSLYSKQFNFYNQFGYIPYKKVMLKYFNQVDLSTDSLDRIIKSIGKF